MTEPANARRTSRGRSYVWSYRDPELIVPSVTSILSTVLAKPAIPRWATNQCGQYVVDNVTMLAGLVARGQHEAVAKMVAGSPWSQRDKAADRGSLVHALAEAMTLGRTPAVPDEAKGYIEGWLRWMDDVSPKPVCAETTVYHPQYAGTLDLIAETERWGTIMVDYKTGKDVYPDVALQLVAYRYAEFIGAPDGTEHKLPEIHATYCLRLTADGSYAMVPVRTDASVAAAWAYVVGLYHHVNRDDLLGSSLGPGRLL